MKDSLTTQNEGLWFRDKGIEEGYQGRIIHMGRETGRNDETIYVNCEMVLIKRNVFCVALLILDQSSEKIYLQELLVIGIRGSKKKNGAKNQDEER